MVTPEAFVHTGYAQRIHFGAGALNRVAEVVRETGARRALLVTTASRRSSDDGERLVKLLGRTAVEAFTAVRSHVPTGDVQAALAMAGGSGVDCVVSFGGGSCTDLGKAVCYFLEQQSGAPGASYIDRPAVSHVAIPTTYSGAELTPAFGMTDEASRSKSGSGGPTIAPIAVIHDPELTLSTPARVSAETGMNALAHGVEVAWSTDRSPEAEALGLACIAGVVDALPRVVDDPSDLAARTDMLAAAGLGGRALHNATVGVHHGLSQLLGARAGIAHGLANAMILPHAMRFNADVIPTEIHRIGVALGDPGDAPGATARLVERLGLPSGLAACGVTEEDLEVVSRDVESNRSVRTNPRPVGQADALAILTAAM